MTLPSLPYEQFLRNKTIVAHPLGMEISPDAIHPALKYHQKQMVLWLCRMGRAACFASFGIGKTLIQIETIRQVREQAGGMGLIVAPLGVRGEFMRDASMIGVTIRFVRSIEECDDSEGIYITNYETIRDGKLNPQAFTVTSLDEAAILRGFGATKTFREFMRLFEGVRYKFIATATPSPNEFIELLAYSAYLEVMEVGEAKTRFFKRDSTKADKLTLHSHKEREFWLWVSSWALFVQQPSDIGGNDDGYILPDLRVHWHEIPAKHSGGQKDDHGQCLLFDAQAIGITEAAREKRESLDDRVSKVQEILRASNDPQCVIWCDLNAEQNALDKMLKEERISFSSLYGNQDIEARESLMDDWRSKRTRAFVSKPQMYGAGVNLQQSHTMVFTGIGFKFADFIQGVHRCQRFLQDHPVELHMIYTENERQVRQTLERKWQQHLTLTRTMSGIIKEFGLDNLTRAEAMARALGVEREEVVHDKFKVVHNDTVLETRSMLANSVGLILTSIPFSTQYEYSPNYCYDELTEVLTRKGWMSFGDISEDMQIATINQDNLHMEWQTPSCIIWEQYSGDMLHFKNCNNFDLLVTPDHSLFLDNRVGNCKNGRKDKRYQKVIASHVADNFVHRKYRMINAAMGANGPIPESIHIPQMQASKKGPRPKRIETIQARDFMELAGWFLSEGYCDPIDGKHGGRISLCQTNANPSFREEMKDLVTRIGLGAQEQERAIVCHNKSLAAFLINNFGSGSHNKRIPLWVKDLHPSLLRVLRDTMMKGDGSKTGFDYTSYSENLRNDFQYIAFVTGWGTSIRGNRVQIGKRQVFPEIRKKPDVVKYQGMIGCATVPNGTLVVRRKGVVCVSGNCDFGHSDSNEHFFEQMDYLTPELLRTLKPGRMAVIHVKDRIVPGGMTGLGFQTVYPFHARCIDHYTRHGFAYMGMKTIVTDVVRENNQTYRLGWTEQCKDATKMGVGMPEYLLMFRKPQTDTTRSYTDDPVMKSKPDVFSTEDDKHKDWADRQREPMKPGDKRPCVRGTGYSRARWQIDAHGFSRSSGDRFPTTEEIRSMPHEAIFKAFRKYGLEDIYEYEQHVGIGEDMEEDARLPVTFMLLQPPSWSPDVWTDIARMRCLNGEQKHKGKQMHLCLARDSRVLTRDHGYIPIQEVSCLDQVLTHKGRWRPVLQVKNTGIQPVITVKAQGVPGLTLTPDHNLWTRKSIWARSRDGAERAAPCWIEAQHTLSAYLNQKTPPVEFADAGDETLWWTLGRWLADGHIDSHGGAILSIGHDKWNEFVSKAGRFVVNAPYDGTALQILLTDTQRELRNILKHCGSGAGHKHLPPAAFVLPFEQSKALIDGYLSGDGHFISERNSWQASSISRDLLLGLSILVQRVYQSIPSIFSGRPQREHVIDGRTVQARQEWTMSFSIGDSRKRPFILDDGAWKKVSSLTDAGEAETWCLKVEEDESFTAEGCVVKNCPMQFDIADRVINQLSAPGDTVYDPFGGLMTVPYRAIKLGRFGMGVELSKSYFMDGLFYCQQAAEQKKQPTLFDFLDAEDECREYGLQDAA